MKFFSGNDTDATDRNVSGRMRKRYFRIREPEGAVLQKYNFFTPEQP
jgi:hypothetical protein